MNPRSVFAHVVPHATPSAPASAHPVPPAPASAPSVPAPSVPAPPVPAPPVPAPPVPAPPVLAPPVLAPPVPPPPVSTTIAPATPSSAASPTPNAGPIPRKTRKGLKPNKEITKGQKSRAGVSNYTDADVCALLDFVEKVQPLGANHWAMVALDFGEWAKEMGQPVRDQDSLKNKFDKLANAKKKTGDPSCPPNVRRAKHIARDIQAKCSAMTLDDDSSVEEESKEDTECTEERTSTSVGECKDKRKTAATGTLNKRKLKTEDALLGHIGDMAEHMGVMCKMMTPIAQSGVTREEVTNIVKEEVKENLRPTNDLLFKMHSMLESMSSQNNRS